MVLETPENVLGVAVGQAPHGDPLADLFHPHRDLWDARRAEKPSNRGSRTSLSVSHRSLELEVSAYGGEL